MKFDPILGYLVEVTFYFVTKSANMTNLQKIEMHISYTKDHPLVQCLIGHLAQGWKEEKKDYSLWRGRGIYQWLSLKEIIHHILILNALKEKYSDVLAKFILIKFNNLFPPSVDKLLDINFAKNGKVCQNMKHSIGALHFCSFLTFGDLCKG